MNQIISCESNYNVRLQPNHHYKKDRPHEGVFAGEREKSFGLVQIHLPAHPEVTYEQAVDPEFAIEFLAKGIKNGEIGKWTCAKLLALN